MRQLQRQQLQQKFSPQQIELMRLLQLPVTELEKAIKEEVEKNPLLEAEAPPDEPLPQADSASDWDADDEDNPYEYDYREHLEGDPNQERREFVVADNLSFTERLMEQLRLRPLSERQQAIAAELIGTLDDAGYLSRPLALVANDMAFRQGVDASETEVEEVLHIVQSLDPAGVGARSLRECLLLQLQRRQAEGDAPTQLALRIVDQHFDDFAEHRYAKICEALSCSKEEFDEAAALVRRLNPKPGGSMAADEATAETVIPDVILSQYDGQLQFYINDGHLPRLSLNTYYTDLLHQLEQQRSDRQTLQFLKQKQSDAQGFIDLLHQRHDTIARIMRYIVSHQRRYLLSGNPDQLVPMRLREVAEATGLDISTVSRMANSKYLQTDFGTIPLKECFSKGMATEGGEEVSVEVIKQRLAEAIAHEDKRAPLSDDALAKQLNAEGLPLARRTVAKYREQLGFPVARLRKVLLLLLCLSGLGMAKAQVSYYDSIIAARIEASQRAPKQEIGRAADQPAAKAAKAKAKKEAIPPTPPPEPSRAAAEYAVPMWYTDFPSHRVNPAGRTDLSLLPDEINLILCRDSADFCFPVKGMKSSAYGWRWQRGHHGVDITLRTGDPVHAAFGGTVRVASRMGGYGNCIVVRHPNGLETLYGHLSKINVRVGQTVVAGETIGLGGSTGNSTGPHLHFECRFLYQTFDPEWILDIEHQSLRTRRLHLDKSYFGIRQPRKGEQQEYKADGSIIRESNKRSQNLSSTINPKDF